MTPDKLDQLRRFARAAKQGGTLGGPASIANGVLLLCDEVERLTAERDADRADAPQTPLRPGGATPAGGAQPLTLGSLCTGYGGLDMAVAAVLPVQLAWVADPDPGAAALLAHHHPDVPNLHDITTVHWEDVARVDILTGGYPCQPFSLAGRREGTCDARHLWPHIARAVRHLRPRLLILENVAGHRSLGFDRVLGDLAEIGFDAKWTSVRACDVDAAHERERVFIAAWPAASDPAYLGHERGGCARGRRTGPAHGRLASADPDGDERLGQQGEQLRGASVAWRSGVDWGIYASAIARWEHAIGRPAPHPVGPTAKGGQGLSPVFVEWMMGLPASHVTGVPGLSRNQQLKLLGNGVVPQQGAAALAELLDRSDLAVA